MTLGATLATNLGNYAAKRNLALFGVSRPFEPDEEDLELMAKLKETTEPLEIVQLCIEACWDMESFLHYLDYLLTSKVIEDLDYERLAGIGCRLRSEWST